MRATRRQQARHPLDLVALHACHAHVAAGLHAEEVPQRLRPMTVRDELAIAIAMTRGHTDNRRLTHQTTADVVALTQLQLPSAVCHAAQMGALLRA